MKLLVLLYLIALTEILLCIAASSCVASDSPCVSLNESSFVLTEGGDGVSVCVTVSPEMVDEQYVTVQLSKVEVGSIIPDDLMIIPESLVLNITSNSTGSNNCWTVTAFDDDIFEETIEMFTLELMVVDNSDTTFTEGLKTAVFNITDNDNATVSFAETSITTNEGDPSIELCVRLVGPAGGTERSIMVVLTSNFSEVELTPTFEPPGKMEVEDVCITYNISVLNNCVYDTSPRMVGTLTLVSRDTRVRVNANDTLELYLIDDDDPVVGLQNSSYTLNEGMSEETIAICVVLDGPAEGLATDLSFNVTFSTHEDIATDNMDYSVLSPSLTVLFESLDAVGEAKCIKVKVLNDNISDPDESFTVAITSPVSRVNITRNTATVVIIDDDAFGPVGELTIARVNSTTLTVNWNEPTTLNGVIPEYYIVSIGVEGNSSVTEYNTTSSTTTSLTRLAPYTPYKVSVTPVNGAGRGETVSTIEFTVEGVPISHPRDIEIQRISDTIVQLSWTPLTRSEARGFITNYTVVYWIADSSDSKRSTVTVEGNSVNITDLDPGSAYMFTVSASTVQGASKQSAIMMIPAAMAAELPLVIIAGAGGGAVVVLLLLVIIVLCIVCMIKSKRSYKPKQQKYVRPLKHPRNLDFTLAEKVEVSLELELGKSSEVKEKEEMDTCFNSREDIPVVDFSGHVKEMHKDDDTGFEREYKSVKDGGHSWEAGQLSENKFKKNRFTNIFPYDCCRVKLVSTNEVGSDYINASWINGYKRDKAYIAAQGPMSATINDFWRMIWENKLPTIVMVTKLVENAREKCSCYWPGAVGEELEAGPDLVILLKEIKVFTDYEIRVMSIKNVSEPDSVPFLVTHFYYLGWPDHGVPEYATSLLGYLRRVRKSHLPNGPPLLVHCSAGVGRTGTFIVLDAMLQRIQSERTINVLQCVQELRERRCQMVQTMSQYVFIHDALNELITCGDTEVAAHNLSIATNQLSRVAPGKSLSGYEEQFQLLDQVSRVPTQQDKDRMSPELTEKNRYPDKFPYMVQQPKLTGLSTQDQYINASFIDGYKRRRYFISTQAPLDNTIVDFWKMATCCKPESRTIVLLCDLVENGKSTCTQYWPEEVGGSATYGKVVVKLVSETTDRKDVIVRKLEISSTVKATVNESYMLTMFHYKKWNENGTQPELESVLHLNELVVISQRTTGNNSIIVMCNDGCGRSGTFLSVYSSIDRFKVEAVVDVFQCVKAARIHRMGLVANVEQYILVHEVVKNYMNSFDQYANFTAQLL